MIFDIVNEYQNVYAGFNGWLCQEKLTSKCYYAINRPKIGVTSGLNWYCVAHPKFMPFGVKIHELSFNRL